MPALVVPGAVALAASPALPLPGVGASVPDSGGFLVGTVATLMDDDAAAARGYGAALDVDPDNVTLQHGTFFHALLAGDPRAVVLAARQGDGVSIYMRGNAAFIAEDWDRARADFTAVPHDRIGQIIQPMLLGWIAIAQGRDGDPALAAQVAQARGVLRVVVLHATPLGDLAEASAPGAVSPREGLALTYVLAALVVQEQMRTLAGHDATLVRRLRDVERVMLRLALQVQPTHPVARLLLAEVLQTLHQADAARAVIGAIDPHGRLAPLLTYRLALIEAGDGNPARAQALVAGLLRSQPHNPVLLGLMGDLLGMMKKPSEARAAYDRAIAISAPLGPQNWALLLSRAVASDQLGDWARAQGDLRQAVKLAPNQPELLNYLGYSMVLHGQSLPQARALLARALSLDPGNAAIRDSVGWAEFQSGAVDQALADLQQAAEKTPLDPTVNYHLGEVYLKAGRRHEAVDEFDRALHLNPDPQDLRAIRRAIGALNGP